MRVPPEVLEGHRKSITAVELDGEGPLLVSASTDETVRQWDLLAGRERRAWPTKNGWATALALGPDQLVAAGTVGGAVHLWRTDAREPLAHALAHDAKVTALAFPARTLLATGSRDGTIKLWRLPALTLLATLVSLPEGWVAFAPDGRYKAGGRVDGQF